MAKIVESITDLSLDELGSLVTSSNNLIAKVLEKTRALTGGPEAVSYTHLTLPTNREV